MYKINYSVYIFAFFIYCLGVLMMPHFGLGYDIGCWIDWAKYIHQHSLGKIYESGCNYLPGHLFELKAYTLIFPSEILIVQNIHYLKYFTFLFDVAGALLVSSLVQESSKQKLILMVLLLNPAYVHNTVAWGQFDSVFTFFIFASFIYLYHKKNLWSIIFLVISLNFKLQAIMFIPVLILLAIYLTDLKFNWKKTVIGILVIAVIQTCLILPFLLQGNFSSVINNLSGLAGDYNYVSLKAANIWYYFLQGDLRWTGDWNTFLTLTFKKWGLIMLSAAIFISTYPLMKGIFLKLKGKAIDIPFQKLLIIFGLIPVCFFFFNTQMHERYSYPAFIFIAAFAAVTDKWWIYLLFSVAYLLNNESALQSSTIINYKSFAFNYQVNATIYLLVIIASVYFLYTKSTKYMRPINK